MLVGEKDRNFKSPTDGRLLNVTGRVYKLKDKGEGQVRIVLNAPIEALADLDASLSLLERIMSPNVEALNVLRVAIQKASEHCRRELKRRYATIRIDGTEVHAELVDSPFDDPATPGLDEEGNLVEFAEGEDAEEDSTWRVRTFGPSTPSEARDRARARLAATFNSISRARVIAADSVDPEEPGIPF
jgi:hypothetical protein